MNARPRLLAATPLLIVTDLPRALAFYTDAAGFQLLGQYGEPPCFAMLHRDGFELMLRAATADVPPHPNGPHDVWDVVFAVADVAAEQRAWTAAGVAIAKGPSDTFYAMREIEVLDPDGHRLCFAQDLSRGDPTSVEAWSATLDLGGQRLRLVLHLEATASGHVARLDSLDQNAMGLPTATVTKTATSLAFTMPTIGAAYTGDFVATEPGTITGTWSQRGRTWPLTWRREG